MKGFTKGEEKAMIPHETVNCCCVFMQKWNGVWRDGKRGLQAAWDRDVV
jgi:hypothetical protein